MKVILIGGHLSPALSLLEELKNEEVIFFGRKYSFEGDKALSLEYQLVEELNIPFVSITTGRLQRKLTRHTFSSFLKLPIGFFQSINALIKYKPDVVLGFGGYISIPVILASFVLRIPAVIHEQTLEAGFANKILSRFAQKICISWESSFPFFPKEKTVLTGNPIRKELFEKNTNEFNFKNNLPIIYITGGSSGSHAINEIVSKVLKKILSISNIVHQVGDAKEFNDFEKLLKLKDEIKETEGNYKLMKFLNSNHASEVLNKADLVVSRSGINTVAELIYLKKPSLLIPLPFSQKNEQFKNALFAKRIGIAEVIEQKDLTEENFFSTIFDMLKNRKKYESKIDIYSKTFKKSAGNIVNVLKNVIKNEKTFEKKNN
jgi:UDP-N-acetylglucosamine--N-acetylmuramyl-(pentapeptide) pyrophosphoryl-undecaprenol N-acetylglucosamine transferase